MATQFSSGKNAIAECDVCDFRYKLTELKPLTIKGKVTGILACPSCWDEDQPQLHIGEVPVSDPQAVRNPRPDVSYLTSGTDGLQLTPNTPGTPESGSRVISWGWNPVGGPRDIDDGLTPNALLLKVYLGTVTIVTV